MTIAIMRIIMTISILIINNNSRGFALLPPAPLASSHASRNSVFRPWEARLYEVLRAWEARLYVFYWARRPWEARFYVFCEAPRPWEARLYVLYVSQSVQVLRIRILEGWRPPSSIHSSLLEGRSPPRARHPHLEYRKCAQNHWFLAVFSRKQPKTFCFCSKMRAQDLRGRAAVR